MTTYELIRALNNCITPYNRKCDGCPYEGYGYPECAEVMISDAAARLEELIERVSMSNITPDVCENCQEFVCDGCKFVK